MIKTAMNMKRLEAAVERNGDALTKIMLGLMAEHADKYAVFHDGEVHYSKSFSSGVNLGMRTFGKENGFVVRRVSTAPTILSSFVLA